MWVFYLNAHLDTTFVQSLGDQKTVLETLELHARWL